ncbi:hypothetical protein BK816_07310 [Boudabousia tangfeifanii]|uniref:Thioredoxin-like fold domain-containing protein n=1 Tax=Boudabousia tangfeifanii TaxID=1912795 RepID=A0A1D9MLE5_9ACTO|nr:DsbA family protein [Boudabousia tangfeifanii]AOZ73122.1 hypothetical protein BK816_07310 [Boudabousia tangfeifanii]
MAKNTKGTANNDIAARAAKMRAEAQRKERNTRIAIWSAVIVALLVAAGIIIWAVSQGDESDRALGDYSNGQPIVVTKAGVGTKVDDKLPTVDEYISYTCSHCAHAEDPVGKPLAEAAQAGKINLRLHLVDTAHMPWIEPATAAAIILASEAPDKFLSFHHDALEFMLAAAEKQDASVVTDPAKSLEKIKSMLSSLGVSQNIIDKVDAATGRRYLDASSKEWTNHKFENQPEGLGTPMYAVNNSVVSTKDGGTVADLKNAIFEAAKIK